MNASILKFWLLSAIFLTGNLFAAGSSEDEAAIRALEARQPEAWNKHDAKAYANLFTESGDCVNIVGCWWKGRAEVEKKLTDAYVYVFKESTLTITNVDVRFLTPDVAVAHGAMDDDRRDDAGWHPSSATGPSDPCSAKAKRSVSDRSISKHAFSAGNAFPEGAGRAERTSQADTVAS
jgi:uncharacterized protein (TIGR02246 family)